MKQRRLAALFGCALFFLVAYAVLAAVSLAFVRRPLVLADIRAGYRQSYRLYDRNGQFLREAANQDGLRADWLELDEIPLLSKQALLAAEDQRFYLHDGIDIVSLLRAGLGWLTASSRSGASTITMQAARLVWEYPRTVPGKLGQLLGALRLERQLSKSEILELYFNYAPFGGPTRGIEAASRYWFDKPVLHLSLAETASLVGMLQSPGMYDPVRYPEANLQRRSYVLDQMLTAGIIDGTERLDALAALLDLRTPMQRPRAMHFTDWLLAQNPPSGILHTTIDLGLNEELETLVRYHVERMDGIDDAAIIVLNNQTMEILAMVGSPDYWRSGDGSVNGTVAPRQPGSTLKPFLYAWAFDHGYGQGTVLPDVPVQYQGADGMLYEPRNHSDEFLGPVTAYEALGRSLNIPAIWLLNKTGLRNFAELLYVLELGDFRANADQYGLGIILGSAETNLLALARAYSLFAREGRLAELKYLLPDPASRTPVSERAVFSPQAAFLVQDILNDERIRLRAFGAANTLMLGYPLAVKTGTSENWRDTWSIGFNNKYTIAVWAGNFDGRPTERMSGSVGAGPLLHSAASLVLSKDWTALAMPDQPDGVVRVDICPVSGQLPGPDCPKSISYFYLENCAPLQQCTQHYAVELDSRNGSPADSSTPDKYRMRQLITRLGPEYSAWQNQASPLVFETYEQPTAVAELIRFPRDGDRFLIEPGYDIAYQSIELQAELPDADYLVAWYVNGNLLELVGTPYVSTLGLSAGDQEIVAVCLPKGAEAPPLLSEKLLDGEFRRSGIRIRVD